VRNNTPQDSVFLTYYSIQCPPAFIGGRITVSSYINWPYGWGIPLSQVYQRENDINNAYNGTAAQLEAAVKEYKVSYVYVGNDELSNYPGCVQRFDVISWLKVVYTNQNLEIFQVELPENGT
jgi:uncharacterized membrane protein